MEPIITNETSIDKKYYLKLLMTSAIPKIKKLYLFLFIVIFILYLLLNFEFSYTLLIFGIFYLALLPLMYYRSFKRIIDNPLNASMFIPYRYEFYETQLFHIDVEMSTKLEVDYRRIVKKQHKGGYYYLYINSFYTLALPETAFQSEQDHQKFRELFNFNN